MAYAEVTNGQLSGRTSVDNIFGANGYPIVEHGATVPIPDFAVQNVDYVVDTINKVVNCNYTYVSMAPDQIVAKCREALFEHANSIAMAKGYDNMHTLKGYAGNPNTCPDRPNATTQVDIDYNKRQAIRRRYIIEGNAFNQWVLAYEAEAEIYETDAMAAGTPPTSVADFVNATVTAVGDFDWNNYAAWLANTPNYNG
jgi:hypothetical protein